MGGVFGFFLGVTMLKCLKSTWKYAMKSQMALSKPIRNAFKKPRLKPNSLRSKPFQELEGTVYYRH